MDISNIQKRISQINKYKEEIKITKEAIDNQLKENDLYQESVKRVKEATATKKRIKEEIVLKPENEKLIWNIKEAKEEIQTLEQILSTELVQYYHKNNTDEILDENGEKIKFRISVKLIKSN